MPRPPLEIFRWYTKSGYPPKVAPVYDSHADPLERAMGTHKIQGDRYSGKSSLGETISYLYLVTGGAVYDIYSANDNESLAWLDSAWADNVTLLTGSNCTLSFSGKEYKQMRAVSLDPRLAGPQNIFVAGRAFFQTEEDYYRAMWALSNRFKLRTSYDRVDVIFMREAQEVVTGVLKAGVARSEKDAIAAFIRFHNQLFHYGFAVVLDSQRDVEVSKSVRELADWNYFKNMGGMEIPRRFWHTFSKVHPNRVYRALEPWQFVIYCKGRVGLGRFQMPPWHIERGRDIMTRLGIKPNFEGLPVDEFAPASQGGSGAGRPRDERLRAEIKKMILEGKTYNQIETALHTSNKTITKVKVELRMKEERHKQLAANSM
jgi:hypothetical protein